MTEILLHHLSKRNGLLSDKGMVNTFGGQDCHKMRVTSMVPCSCLPLEEVRSPNVSNGFSILKRKCGDFTLWRRSALTTGTTERSKTKRSRSALLLLLSHQASSEFSNSRYHIYKFFCPPSLPENTFFHISDKHFP